MKLSVTALLSPDPLSSENRQELLTIINEEIDRLNRLVGEAAEMAQLDAHQIELRRQPHPVRAVVDLALEKQSGLLRGREITLQIPDQLPLVAIDIDRVARIGTASRECGKILSDRHAGHNRR